MFFQLAKERPDDGKCFSIIHGGMNDGLWSNASNAEIDGWKDLMG